MIFAIPDYNAPVKTDPGEVLLANKLPNHALPFLEKGFKAKPENDRAETLYGLGLFYCDYLKEAEEHLLRVINRNPGYAMAHHGYANWLETHGRFGEALIHFRAAAETKPDIPTINYGIAACLLRAGHFDEAWPYWEKGRVRLTVDFLPAWEGEPLQGRKLLVIKEGGFGDSFWLMRYFPILKQMGAHITFYAFSNCRGLMGKHPWIDRLVDASQAPDSEEFDLQISLMSIMPMLKVCPLVTEGPYFRAVHPYPRNGKPRIGICWAASEMGGAGKRIRSTTAEEIDPLREIPVEWMSLQLDEEVPSWMVHDEQAITGWHKTCDVIASCDAVVTVDTAVAHLAGAMGKKTYLMLPLNAEWKWCFQDAVKSWYPSIVPFWNTDPISMRPVVQQVAEQLRKDF